MGWSLSEDLKQGSFNEKKVMYWLNKNKYQEDRIIPYKRNFKQVDFKNNSIIGELKSRNCNLYTYPDTIVGLNKINYLKNKPDTETRDFKFYFLFYDGLYVWDYSEDEYEVKPFYHKEKGRNVDYAFIQVELLKPLSKDITTSTSLPSDLNEWIVDTERI